MRIRETCPVRPISGRDHGQVDGVGAVVWKAGRVIGGHRRCDDATGSEAHAREDAHCDRRLGIDAPAELARRVLAMYDELCRSEGRVARSMLRRCLDLGGALHGVYAAARLVVLQEGTQRNAGLFPLVYCPPNNDAGPVADFRG